MAGITQVLQANGIQVDQLFQSFEEGETCKTFEMDLKVPGCGDKQWPVKFKAERIVECGVPMTKVSDFEMALSPEQEKELDEIMEREQKAMQSELEESSPSESP